MANDLSEQLSRVGDKIRLLLIRHEAMRRKVEELSTEVAGLKAGIVARDSAIERLTTEVEYLKMSSRIAPDAEAAENARAVISELVREIDRCIADLGLE